MNDFLIKASSNAKHLQHPIQFSIDLCKEFYRLFSLNKIEDVNSLLKSLENIKTDNDGMVGLLANIKVMCRSAGEETTRLYLILAENTLQKILTDDWSEEDIADAKNLLLDC